MENRYSHNVGHHLAMNAFHSNYRFNRKVVFADRSRQASKAFTACEHDVGRDVEVWLQTRIHVADFQN